MAKRRDTSHTGRAGEHYVAAELNRRGSYASPFAGNVPGIDIVATNNDRTAVVYIQVKTKQKGNWQLSISHGWGISDPKPCLCLGKCESGECNDMHEHHPDAIDLNKINRVGGKTDHYWVFVSLQGLQEVKYWIVPDVEVRDQLIRERHIAYLERKGGHRPGQNHGSLHISIPEKDLAPWKGAWDSLGLGLSP